ncbi:MAG: MBL fold metallo-hydrolase [Oligoflexia bacterium]|nr:MBL fold metallo-hydrolase [Oligoflexia bacterium]
MAIVARIPTTVLNINKVLSRFRLALHRQKKTVLRLFYYVCIITFFCVLAIIFEKKFFSFSSQFSSYLLSKITSFEWTAIDVTSVTQGDAHLLRFNDTYYLVDTGAPAAGASLIDYLEKRKIKEFKKIIITHPHFDHYGNLALLAEKGFKIGEVMINFPSESACTREPWGCNPADLLQIKKILGEKGIPIKTMTRGDKFSFSKKGYFLSNLELEILHVYGEDNSPVGPIDINDQSAIILVTHGRNRYLFTGDLNVNLGDWLTQKESRIRGVDIIKVPHHGASTLPNNDFFTAVAAKTAIVTIGKYLWYSDRCERVRELLTNVTKSKVYVTGIHHHITVHSYAMLREIISGFFITTTNN